jgi:Fic family protein
VDPSQFANPKAGRAIKHPTGYWTFMPADLPPDLDLSVSLIAKLSKADQRLGKLEGLCLRLPNPHLLAGAFAIREAVRSSNIEGTRATQADLYLFDMEPESARHPEDVREVRNYVEALNHAIRRKMELPLSLRLIREVHERLMQGVRGKDKTPGEFRKSQNWIDGPNPDNATYVPPPVPEMNAALDQLEKFLHRPESVQIPVLIECALIHYQFEAIHPFLDGNGRTGRLLTTLLLIERECLSHPVLYLSAYLDNHRAEYFAHLMAVSRTGKWDSWLEFFVDGIAEQADDGIWRADLILKLHAEYRNLAINKQTARLLIEDLMANPYVTIKSICDRHGVTDATAAAAIKELQDHGILAPLYPERKRKQVFFAKSILNAFMSTRSNHN